MEKKVSHNDGLYGQSLYPPMFDSEPPPLDDNDDDDDDFADFASFSKATHDNDSWGSWAMPKTDGVPANVENFGGFDNVMGQSRHQSVPHVSNGFTSPAEDGNLSEDLNRKSDLKTEDISDRTRGDVVLDCESDKEDFFADDSFKACFDEGSTPTCGISGSTKEKPAASDTSLKSESFLANKGEELDAGQLESNFIIGAAVVGNDIFQKDMNSGSSDFQANILQDSETEVISEMSPKNDAFDDFANFESSIKQGEVKVSEKNVPGVSENKLKDDANNREFKVDAGYVSKIKVANSSGVSTAKEVLYEHATKSDNNRKIQNNEEIGVVDIDQEMVNYVSYDGTSKFEKYDDEERNHEITDKKLKIEGEEEASRYKEAKLNVEKSDSYHSLESGSRKDEEFQNDFDFDLQESNAIHGYGINPVDLEAFSTNSLVRSEKILTNGTTGDKDEPSMFENTPVDLIISSTTNKPPVSDTSSLCVEENDLPNSISEKVKMDEKKGESSINIEHSLKTQVSESFSCDGSFKNGENFFNDSNVDFNDFQTSPHSNTISKADNFSSQFIPDEERFTSPSIASESHFEKFSELSESGRTKEKEGMLSGGEYSTESDSFSYQDSLKKSSREEEIDFNDFQNFSKAEITMIKPEISNTLQLNEDVFNNSQNENSTDGFDDFQNFATKGVDKSTGKDANISYLDAEQNEGAPRETCSSFEKINNQGFSRLGKETLACNTVAESAEQKIDDLSNGDDFQGFDTATDLSVNKSSEVKKEKSSDDMNEDADDEWATFSSSVQGEQHKGKAEANFGDFAAFPIEGSSEDNGNSDDDWASFDSSKPAFGPKTLFSGTKAATQSTNELENAFEARPFQSRGLENFQQQVPKDKKISLLLAPSFPKPNEIRQAIGFNPYSKLEAFIQDERDQGLRGIWGRLSNNEELGEAWKLSFTSSTNFKLLLQSVDVAFEKIMKKYKHSSRDTLSSLSPASSVASFDAVEASIDQILVPEPAAKLTSLLRPTLLAQSQQKELDLQRVPSASSLKKEELLNGIEIIRDFLWYEAPATRADISANMLFLRGGSDVELFGPHVGSSKGKRGNVGNMLLGTPNIAGKDGDSGSDSTSETNSLDLEFFSGTSSAVISSNNVTDSTPSLNIGLRDIDITGDTSSLKSESLTGRQKQLPPRNQQGSISLPFNLNSLSKEGKHGTSVEAKRFLDDLENLNFMSSTVLMFPSRFSSN